MVELGFYLKGKYNFSPPFPSTQFFLSSTTSPQHFTTKPARALGEHCKHVLTVNNL